MTGPRVKVARRTFVESPKRGQCLLDHTRRLHEEPYREGTVVYEQEVNLEVVARTTGFRLRSWKHRPYVNWLNHVLRLKNHAEMRCAMVRFAISHCWRYKRFGEIDLK